MEQISLQQQTEAWSQQEEKGAPGQGGRQHAESPLDRSWWLVTNPPGNKLKPSMGKLMGKSGL